MYLVQFMNYRVRMLRQQMQESCHCGVNCQGLYQGIDMLITVSPLEL